MTSTPPPGLEMTISLWTVAVGQRDGQARLRAGAGRGHGPGAGRDSREELTVPGAASVVMLPGAPAAQLQWNVT